MDDEFWEALKLICSGYAAAALITVTRVKGSTPRKPGAKMLLLRDGQSFGTIGGGCGEAEVRQEALYLLDTQNSSTYWVNMTNDMAEEEGMVCGGMMEVFIDIIRTGPSRQKEILASYVEELEKGKKPVLFTVVNSSDSSLLSETFYLTAEGEAVGGEELGSITNAARTCQQGVGLGGKISVLNLDCPDSDRSPEGSRWVELLVEPAPAKVDLIVLGGGHIALPLALMAKMLGYKVSVVDDRPDFANSRRFPGVDKVICNDFGKAISQLEFGSSTFVVIITRGHKHDKVCLRQVISKQYAYIGMIGSRRRVKALLEEMKQEGTARGILEKVHTPIGLAIGAETPEEIAISILAEIIKVQRGGKEKATV